MVLRSRLVERFLVGHTHLLGISAVWLPFSRGPWSRLLKHAINLLEGETLGLGNAEVGEGKARAAGGAPNEEHLGAEVALVWVNNIGSHDANDLQKSASKRVVTGGSESYAVPEPIGGS